MRIAVDALGISQPGGGRSATLNLLQPLLALDHDNDYLIFVDAHEPSLAGYGNVRQVDSPTQHRFAVRAWAQATWPLLLRRERAQVIHYTKNLTTLLNPCPSVVTVHDLTILVHPEIYPAIDVWYWRTIERACLQRVDRIIAVSASTGQDLERIYGLPAERIEVINEGIDDSFGPVSSGEVARVRAKYQLPPDYLLHVGSISAKKNLSTLARAYGRLVAQGKFDGALVLVGRSYWRGGDDALDAHMAREARAGDIIRTGPVPQSDLPALYAGATCFVFPSLHEGFGLVPLEAVACGTPVVASRVGALDELLGQVALFVEDPLDDVALADQISLLLEDSGLRDTLRSRGLERAPHFSRETAARKTLSLYRTLAHGGAV